MTEAEIEKLRVAYVAAEAAYTTAHADAVAVAVAAYAASDAWKAYQDALRAKDGAE
jgi:hypothetical protein